MFVGGSQTGFRLPLRDLVIWKVSLIMICGAQRQQQVVGGPEAGGLGAGGLGAGVPPDQPGVSSPLFPGCTNPPSVFLGGLVGVSFTTLSSRLGCSVITGSGITVLGSAISQQHNMVSTVWRSAISQQHK